MPKYWREIAIEAQEEAAYLYAEARRYMALLAEGQADPRVARLYQVRAARCSARVRWAMEAPGDCP